MDKINGNMTINNLRFLTPWKQELFFINLQSSSLLQSLPSSRLLLHRCLMVRKERMNMNYNMENIEYRLNQAERQEDEREKIGTSRKIMNGRS